MRVKQIYLSLATWGVNEGKLEGTVTFEGVSGELQIKVGPEEANKIVQLLAEGLVKMAQENANILLEDIRNQAALPAPQA